MSIADQAVACFDEGFNCSQAVFSAFAPQLGLDRVVALKVAGPFGGGIGRMGETCGAVTGALMVIGLKYGQTTSEDKAAKEKSYELVRQFAERFKARNRGCLACRELLGADIGTPEGMQKIREKQAFTTMCPKFVRDAAEIVEELL
jgi:C_GCAxxG_C_C family probable redox protein